MNDPVDRSLQPLSVSDFAYSVGAVKIKARSKINPLRKAQTEQTYWVEIFWLQNMK